MTRNMRVYRNLLFVIISLPSNYMSAQNKKFDSIASKLQDFYNSGSYDTFQNSFSNEMKQVLTLEITNQFLSYLKNNCGNIISRQLVKQSENGSNAFYKITFERKKLFLMLTINEEDKIEEFLFKPYNIPRSTPNSYKKCALKNLPQKQINAIVEQTKDFPNNTQLAIAFIKDGVTNFYGIVKSNNTLKEVENKNAVFEIGSISKVFTATLLANAVIANEIKLDDNISKYYNFPFKDNIELSFKSLSNHTSGLSEFPSNLNALNYLMLSTEENFVNPYKDYNKNDLYTYLQKDLDSIQLSHKQYKYSNLGIGILGYTLSLAEGENLEDLFEEKIFGKYEMTSSYTNISKVKEGLVCGLDDDGNTIKNWEWNSDVFLGAGGILSTTNDLSKFAKAQFDSTNVELALTRTPTFTLNERIKVALGWHIIKSEDNKELYWHNGATGGYSSSMVLDIAHKCGVIILSNVSGYNLHRDNIDKLSFILLNFLEE